MPDHITGRFELFADDVDALRDFFVRVLRFEAVTSTPSYVEVKSGDVRIGIGPVSDLPEAHPLRPQSGERKGLGVEIVIETDDVEAAYAHVQTTGYPVAAALKSRPWGLRDFRLVAPGGYYMRVTSRDAPGMTLA